MEAHLIYNPNSGRSQNLSPEQILTALKEAGYQPVYRPTDEEKELEDVLRKAEGLVVVVGGDGSLRAVVTRLIGRKIPVALIPMGTANNIARTFNIQGKPLEMIARLKDPLIRFMDVGILEGPWCKPDSSADRELFLEAGGFGLFAETLVVYDPNQGKNVLQSIRSIAYALNIEHDYPCPMTLDGEDISGDYIMVEALNMSAFGPRLKFAPEADPSDGLLDVILIERDARESLLTYVSGLINGELENLPSVTHKRGKRLEIEWPGNFYFHVDAELIPSRRNESEESEQRIAPQERPGTVVIELLHKAVELWLPAPSEGVEPGEKPQQDPLTLPKQQIL